MARGYLKCIEVEKPAVLCRLAAKDQKMIVPTLRVGMPQWTLCVRFGTRSVPGCIPTQSVGTIMLEL
jgi:hypothetical protein